MSTHVPWLVRGAIKDRQTITPGWDGLTERLIAGVTVREVKHVPKESGQLTEIYRDEWCPGLAVGQVFHVVLGRGQVSAWHAHAATTDRLFVTAGLLRLCLYDARPESPTRGEINEIRFGAIRPALVTIPPRVWHGLANLGDDSAAVLNLPDVAYCYDDPDHWRVAADSPEIPCCIWHGRRCEGHGPATVTPPGPR